MPTRGMNEIARSYEGMKEAAAVLEKTRNDPDANLNLGKYKCFMKGDWESGLPMLLVLGSDEKLKSLAAKELAGAAWSDDQVKLGDGWWNLAETQKGRAKKQIQGRAAF